MGDHDKPAQLEWSELHVVAAKGFEHTGTGEVRLLSAWPYHLRPVTSMSADGVTTVWRLFHGPDLSIDFDSEAAAKEHAEIIAAQRAAEEAERGHQPARRFLRSLLVHTYFLSDDDVQARMAEVNSDPLPRDYVVFRPEYDVVEVPGLVQPQWMVREVNVATRTARLSAMWPDAPEPFPSVPFEFVYVIKRNPPGTAHTYGV